MNNGNQNDNNNDSEKNNTHEFFFVLLWTLCMTTAYSIKSAMNSLSDVFGSLRSHV